PHVECFLKFFAPDAMDSRFCQYNPPAAATMKTNTTALSRRIVCSAPDWRGFTRRVGCSTSDSTVSSELTRYLAESSSCVNNSRSSGMILLLARDAPLEERCVRSEEV